MKNHKFLILDDKIHFIRFHKLFLIKIFTMKKLITILVYSLLCVGLSAQIIHNSGARIVSESGVHWVIDNGDFTLKSESATNLATMANLKIEADASLTLTPASYLTVSGTLTNNSGTNGLVLQSTVDGTASLIHSTATIEATAQRYIAAWPVNDKYHGWHFLSSPVGAQAISPSFVNISGTMSADVDLYKWSEPENLWINIKNNSNTYNQGTGSTNWSNDVSPQFETGKGYLTAYGTIQTKQFIGNLNVANVAITGMTYTTGKTYRGWHLVGNPFSSAIKWGQGDWVKTNIAAVPQIWNETSASYKVLKGDGIIPAQNGFMVFVTEGHTGALTIPANARLHSDSAWYKNSASINEIILTARDPEGLTAQETIISINPEATQDFDLEYDSYFMAGFAPMFYSTSQGKLFALNSLPELTDELVVPMGFVKNQNSSFSIQLTQNTTDHTLYLEDIKTNVVHNISETPYTFLSTAGDNPNRFLLKFGSVGIDETPVTPVINAWYSRGILNVKTNEGITNIGIFNIQGQQLQNYQLFGSGLQTVSINLPTGVYFARLINDGNMQTVKIIIQ